MGGLVGTRVRNPHTGRPDAWEQFALQELDRRVKAGGETLQDVRHGRRILLPAMKRLRWAGR